MHSITLQALTVSQKNDILCQKQRSFIKKENKFINTFTKVSKRKMRF